MKLLKDREIDKVLDYLRASLLDCLYLYIDLKTCGLADKNVLFWHTENSREYIENPLEYTESPTAYNKDVAGRAKSSAGLNTIVMKYYDSFQIFSAYENWSLGETLNLLNEISVRAIHGPEKIIRDLHKHCADLYNESYGLVVCDNAYRELKLFSKVEQANSGDANEIAALMCSSVEFSASYNQEILAGQLNDRLNGGSGRSYIIRENGKIAAHVGTFAELDDIAVVGGLIAGREFKESFYGIALYEYIKKILRQEEKNIYAMRYTDKMLLNAQACNIPSCSFGKLVRAEDRGQMKVDSG